MHKGKVIDTVKDYEIIQCDTCDFIHTNPVNMNPTPIFVCVSLRLKEKSIKPQTTADKRDRQKKRINADFFFGQVGRKKELSCLRKSAAKGKEYLTAQQDPYKVISIIIENQCKSVSKKCILDTDGHR